MEPCQKYKLTVNDLIILNPDINPEDLPRRQTPGQAQDPVLDVVIELENTVLSLSPSRLNTGETTSSTHQQKILRSGWKGKRGSLPYHPVNGYQESLAVLEEKS